MKINIEHKCIEFETSPRHHQSPYIVSGLLYSHDPRWTSWKRVDVDDNVQVIFYNWFGQVSKTFKTRE